MTRALLAAATLGLLAAAAGWVLALPRPLPAAAVAGLAGDGGRGEAIFHAAGCAGCHAAPGAEGEARRVLSGGRALASPFGTFLAPNVSPDPVHGIGGWSLAAFANALTRGIAPDGRHYYPAFPYTTYARMRLQDVADLKAYMDTLPPSAEVSRPHALSFPFTVRLGLGLWKRRYLDPAWVVTGTLTEAEARGRYLAEALAHCGECHTPRDRLGGPDRSRWLAGAANPTGEGRIPDITPARLSWSEAEIAAYLETGFTPDFDTAGGHMAEVVKSLALLPAADRAAIAAYLRRVPPAR